ncbi:hypothetical protein [Candidatus Vidania fulgoroideorum]
MKFIKIHSYGNNFILVKDFLESINKKKIIKISNEKTGIGFDQAILVYKYFDKKFFIKIFNKDGSCALNCVNGIRCMGYYLFKKLKINRISFIVNYNKYSLISKTKSIFFFLENFIYYFFYFNLKFNYKFLYLRNINKIIQINFYLIKKKFFNFIKFGNIHFIFFNKKKIKSSEFFFIKKIFFIFNFINIDFNLSSFNFKERKVSTLERGSGFTSSCGSATSSSIFLYKKYFNKKIRIKSNYGSMIVNNKKKLSIKGTCYKVFFGLIKI